MVKPRARGDAVFVLTFGRARFRGRAGSARGPAWPLCLWSRVPAKLTWRYVNLC
jgi:hypothetical protein